MIGDRRDGSAGDVEPAIGVIGDDEVQLHGRVESRVVGALVGAAALTTLIAPRTLASAVTREARRSRACARSP